jgi:two-component system LytT family response regulator
MGKIRTLIVDDEALARRRILQLLQGDDEVEIIGECQSGSEAVAAIKREGPDLVFLDVQMPEMDGFRVLREIEDGVVPAVIFVTAYDQFALKAFEVHALDYLVKPYTAERFQAALKRAKIQIESKEAIQLGQRLKTLIRDVQIDPGYVARIEIKQNDRRIFVRIDDILWFKAAGNYVEVRTANATHLIRDTLSRLEAVLNPNVFARIHRSILVRIDQIEQMSPLFNKDHIAVLRDGTQFQVSRTYYDSLISVLRIR